MGVLTALSFKTSINDPSRFRRVSDAGACRCHSASKRLRCNGKDLKKTISPSPPPLYLPQDDPTQSFTTCEK
ncbi:hypothetical protein JGC56_14185 [Salmonella enterica subsp. enterica serovar Saintpaul]|nr:hypothetical protein [Salmonella enterica subsp. enterica serovar Saintpaul]